MASVVTAKVAVERRKKWTPFGRAKTPLKDMGLPGYSSVFSAPPGEGPLEKTLGRTSCPPLPESRVCLRVVLAPLSARLLAWLRFAARFDKVARAIGEAVEAGVSAGDKGNWVWRSSRGWLGEKARRELNARLYKITIEARRALEKVRRSECGVGAPVTPRHTYMHTLHTHTRARAHTHAYMPHRTHTRKDTITVHSSTPWLWLRRSSRRRRRQSARRSDCAPSATWSAARTSCCECGPSLASQGQCACVVCRCVSMCV
jgi:hypothetical protein